MHPSFLFISPKITYCFYDVQNIARPFPRDNLENLYFTAL